MARVGDLEIAQDLGWERRGWAIQRVGWALLAVFLVAAVLGVFGGDGPLREARAGAGDVIAYDRFTRFGSPTELSIVPPPDAVSGGKIAISIESEYLRDFEITSITPSADAVQGGRGVTTFTFLQSEAPGPIDFRLEPREAGFQSGAVRVGEGSPISFSQIVYP